MDKIILSTSIIMLLIIAGCGSGSSNKSTTDADVRKGTNGIVMEFTKNAPPEKVYEDTAFPIGISLMNKGASDIEEHKSFLAIGLEKTYIELEEEADKLIEIEKIQGKSIFNLNGDLDFITLTAKTKKVGAQSETHPSTILATACYPYQTILGTSVCIDADIFGTIVREKACIVNDLEFKEGQGAPVTITKVETRMLPDADNNRVKPHFIIHIEDKGNGEVVSIDKVHDACSSKALEYTDFNKIMIKASLSNKDLNCNIDETTSAEVRLREKKDVVRCTLEEGIDKNRDAYTSPLKIELDYGYTFTISKDIIIEKILTY